MGYKLYSFDEFREAMNAIREQHAAGQPLVWSGPDDFHSSVSAGSPPPSQAFSSESLAYHAEHDRNFDDVCILIAAQFGTHQGIMMEQKNTEFYQKKCDRLDQIIEIVLDSKKE